MTTQSILSYETCVHAIAGSTGSMFAMSVFYPLDTIKFRKQVEENSEHSSTFEALYKLLKTEGFSALYEGIKPVLISLGTSNFIYFYTFHGLKHALRTSSKSDISLGIAAGVINVLLTAPLWVVNSRLKVKKQVPYTGLLDGLMYVAKNEGIEGLWSGIGPSLILVINPAIQFTIYEALKRRMPPKSSITVFAMGAIAKMVATVVTYPLQLAQTRQRYNKDNSKINVAALLLVILKRSGPKGLFQGLEAKLWQTVLTAALMFVAYEKIFHFVLLVLMRNPQKSLKR